MKRNLIERVAQAIHVNFNKSGVVEKYAQLVDLWRAGAYFALCAGDVFAILPASGIRAVSGCHKGERAANAVFLHLAQRIGEHRMPVAISPIDGQLRAVCGEFALDCGDRKSTRLNSS